MESVSEAKVDMERQKGLQEVQESEGKSKAASQLG